MKNFYVPGGGNDNWILKYAIENKKLQLVDSIKLGKKWPEKISPAGIEIVTTKTMYVVTKDNNSLYIINLIKELCSSNRLEAEAYTCLLSPIKRNFYISLWGGDKVLDFNMLQKK